MSFARLPGVLALLLTVILTPAQAATVTATGLGPDPDRAAVQALKEAATQTLGVAHTLTPQFGAQASQWLDASGSVSEWSDAPREDWSLLQRLQGFRVLSRERIGDGLHRAEVELRVTHGENGDATRLSTLLIAPFSTAMNQYPVGGKVPADQVRSELRRHLEGVLAQDSRLNVVDANLDERKLRSLGPSGQIKLGSDLGADLMLVGRIETFALTTHDKKYMGMQFHTLQPRAVIKYQILNTVTREIVRAGTFSDRKLPKSLKQAFADDEIDPEKEPERVGEILYPRVARAMAGEVMETLYPFRVLSAPSKDKVLIGAGRGRLREGDLLSAHRIEREVRDSSIDLGIRVESNALATVSVTELHDDYARGRLMTGNADSLDRGTFLRIQARPEEDKGEERITAP